MPTTETTHTTPEEDKCIELALQFIAENAERHQIKASLGAVTASRMASHVLIGNIAHDRFRSCMAAAPDKEAVQR